MFPAGVVRNRLTRAATLLAQSRIGLAAAAAAVYALSFCALRFSHMGQGWPFVDLGVYRQGGLAVITGRDLYALRFPGDLAFTYPPLSALAFAMLAPFTLSLLAPLLTAANLLLLPIVLALGLRLRPADRWLTHSQVVAVALTASAAALWLEPVWTALRYGQIDLLIAALVLYDLSRPPRSRLQGAAIGLAAGLKLTPAIFAIYLLLTRRAHAAAVSLVAFSATVAAGFAIVPADARSFWGSVFLDSSRVGRPENAANQSLRGALVRVLHSLAVDRLWLASALIVGAGGIALAVAAGRRGDDVRGYSLCALSALLVSPVSWSHHWVLAVPALLLLCVRSLRARSRWCMLGCIAIAAAAFSHVIWWVPINHPAHSELHLDALQLLAADAYVLIALAALAIAARSAVRRRTRCRGLREARSAQRGAAMRTAI